MYSYQTNFSLPRSSLVDTGSPINLDTTEVEEYLSGAKKSNLRCSGATGDSLGMNKVGDMNMHVCDKLGKGGKSMLSVNEPSLLLFVGKKGRV